MPFISKEHFEQQEKTREIQQKIASKKEQHMINETAKAPKEKGLGMQQAMKVMKADMKLRRELEPPKPKPISLSDIKKQLEINDYIETKREEEIEMIVNDAETKEIRNEFMSVLAMPMKGINQRKLFQYKLENSNTINNYINENVLFRMFNRCNSHLKFAAVYGMKYCQTLKEYNDYVNQAESFLQQQQSMKEQQVVQEQKVDVENTNQKKETESESSDESSIASTAKPPEQELNEEL